MNPKFVSVNIRLIKSNIPMKRPNITEIDKKKIDDAYRTSINEITRRNELFYDVLQKISYAYASYIKGSPKVLYEYTLTEIPDAAEKMQEKIRMRKKREALVSFFERSDEAALRVFANQLALVKY